MAQETELPITSRRDLATMTENGRERLQEARSRASEGIDDATTSMGRSVERFGGAIETAGQNTATSVKRAGRYMQESTPATMGSDISVLMGRHPGATLAVGIGLGLVVGRMLTRPSPRL